jgi:hypothetical protein
MHKKHNYCSAQFADSDAAEAANTYTTPSSMARSCGRGRGGSTESTRASVLVTVDGAKQPEAGAWHVCQ